MQKETIEYLEEWGKYSGVSTGRMLLGVSINLWGASASPARNWLSTSSPNHAVRHRTAGAHCGLPTVDFRLWALFLTARRASREHPKRSAC